MLAYRRDLIEQLGIDLRELDTWEKFVSVGQRITKDKNGDGIIDQYMLDLPISGNWGLFTLLFQMDGQIFDENGDVAFNDEKTVELFVWYMRQTAGPKKIAYDCGWGQPFYQAMSDGLALFFWTPDWRTGTYQEEFPKMKGKLGLIPMPAWREGGRRTTSWGGTGLVIAKQTKDPDLAWEFAKFLYFDQEDLGQRFLDTGIIPALKDAWDLPEFHQPNAYFSNLPIGKLYAELAPQTPAIHPGPVDFVGRQKLDEAYSRSVQYYRQNGERGLREKIRAELARSETYVQRIAARARTLQGAD
jgi:ABC-type glycerol-3-phosphate transport system substrate-binding protein